MIGHHRVHTRAFSLKYMGDWTLRRRSVLIASTCSGWCFPFIDSLLLFFFVCQKVQKKSAVLDYDCVWWVFACWKVGANSPPHVSRWIYNILKRKGFSFMLKFLKLEPKKQGINEWKWRCKENGDGWETNEAGHSPLNAQLLPLAFCLFLDQIPRFLRSLISPSVLHFSPFLVIPRKNFKKR